MELHINSILLICVTICPLMNATLEIDKNLRGKTNIYIERPNKSTTFKLETTKLIIDTDSGADDAAAILLLLGQERLYASLKVVGITCVNGNTALDNVVVNVLKTLKTVNRLDIPVYKGAAKSFITTPPSDNYYGEDGFGDFEFPDPPDPNEYLQKEHAVNALVRMVSENPGEITLLCIGPLTNVALAIRMYPDFMINLKQLVVMGGSVEGVGNAFPGIEFNFYIDPVATYIVFNSSDTRNGRVSPIILLPLESAAIRNTISLEWRKNVLGSLSSPEVQLLNNAERYQLEGEDETLWVCCDCLAAGVIADSSIVTGDVTYYAYAIHEGHYSAGAILVDYLNTTLNSPNTRIVQRFNVDAYKNMLLTNVGGAPSKKNNN